MYSPQNQTVWNLETDQEYWKIKYTNTSGKFWGIYVLFFGGIAKKSRLKMS